MVKKGKQAAVEISNPYPVMGEDAKARSRFRFHSLMQDYEELSKETEAKRKRLQKTRKTKLKLLAEVKFLRKKYKNFCENPSQESMYRLKKQIYIIPSHSTHAAQTSVSHDSYVDPSLKDWTQKPNHVQNKQTASPILDLNQSSFPNLEEIQEFQVEWEPLKLDKKKSRCSLEGEVTINDLNVPAYRDGSNGSSRLGKRKITWQDQVALKV